VRVVFGALLLLEFMVACQARTSGPSVRPSVAPTTAGVGNTSPPALSVSPAAAGEEPIQGTFTSTRYRYSFTLPAGWSVTEVPGSGGVHPGEPGLDTFTDGRGTTVTVGVVAVAPTQQLGAWIGPVIAHLEQVHGEPREAVAQLTLGGLPASISTFHFVAPPYRVLELEVEAIRGSQGYYLSWTDTISPTVPDADQRSRFIGLLRGFAYLS